MTHTITVHYTDGKTINLDIEDNKIGSFIEAMKSNTMYYDPTTKYGVWVPSQSVRVIHAQATTTTATTDTTTTAATTTTTDEAAPYGYKKDGTPRKRPGFGGRRRKNTATTTTTA